MSDAHEWLQAWFDKMWACAKDHDFLAGDWVTDAASPFSVTPCEDGWDMEPGLRRVAQDYELRIPTADHRLGQWGDVVHD